MATLENRVTRARKKIAEHEEDFHMCLEDGQILFQKVNKAEKAAKTYEARARSLNTKQTSFEEDLDALKHRLTECETEVQASEDRKVEISLDLDILEEANMACQVDLDERKTAMVDVQLTLTESIKTQEKLHQEFFDYQCDSAYLMDSVNALQTSIDKSYV